MYCDECKDQAHSEKENLIRQRDEAYAKLDATLLQVREAENRIEILNQNRIGISNRLEEALERADVAERLNSELREALEYAYEALKGYGCDCGTDEPGTCGECYLKAFFKERPAGKPEIPCAHDGAVVHCCAECREPISGQFIEKRVDPAPKCVCPPGSMLTVEGCKAHHG